VVNDAERSLSRVHAEIRLDGWDVMLVDRGSANGTFIANPDGSWQRLAADRPERIEPGQRLAFGRRTALFESHHQVS